MRQLGKGNYFVGLLVMALFGGPAGYVSHLGWSERTLKRQLLTEGVSGQATVLDVSLAGGFKMVYSFRVPSAERAPGTEEGRAITSEVRVDGDVPYGFSKGARIPILYLPGHPETNLPVAMARSGTPLLAFLFGGGVALLCGFVVVAMTVKLFKGDYGAPSFFVTGTGARSVDDVAPSAFPRAEARSVATSRRPAAPRNARRFDRSYIALTAREAGANPADRQAEPGPMPSWLGCVYAIGYAVFLWAGCRVGNDVVTHVLSLMVFGVPLVLGLRVLVWTRRSGGRAFGVRDVGDILVPGPAIAFLVSYLLVLLLGAGLGYLAFGGLRGIPLKGMPLEWLAVPPALAFSQLLLVTLAVQYPASSLFGFRNAWTLAARAPAAVLALLAQGGSNVLAADTASLPTAIGAGLLSTLFGLLALQRLLPSALTLIEAPLEADLSADERQLIEKRWRSLGLGVFACLLSVVVASSVFRDREHEKRLAQEGTVTVARIWRLEAVPRQGYQTYYCFTGLEVGATEHCASGTLDEEQWRQLRVGGSLDVVYLPGDPEVSRPTAAQPPPSFELGMAAAMGLLVLGVVFLQRGFVLRYVGSGQDRDPDRDRNASGSSG